MLLTELLAASERVAATRSRLAKIDALGECLRRLEASEIALGVAYLSGDIRQGKIGIGYASLEDALAEAPASAPQLTLAQVDEALARLAQIKGAGSAAERQRVLAELLARATSGEQDFLARLLLGELRQGALEGIMLDAIAKAANLPAARVRAATMRAGGLPAVAEAALTEGETSLARFALAVFQPVQPMLAQAAEDVADALERLGTAAFEWKLDGARVQAHKSGGEIRVYTRSLNEVTSAVPEVVEALRNCAARELILDGETIALRPDGAPYPFQETMRRFGRKLDVETLRATLPLSVFFFDCLLADGTDLTPKRARERFDALAKFLPAKILIPRLVTGDKARDENLRREKFRERVETLPRALRGEVCPVGEQAVEEKDAQGERRAQRLHVELAPEAAHGFLERVGRAVGPECNRLAIKNQLTRCTIAQRLDDLGYGGGDLVEAARIDTDFAARLVRLHACAVQLPLEGRGAEALERVGDVLRGLRKHRLHRLENREREAREARFAFGERGFRDRGKAARAHRRRPHARGGQVRSLRDGVEHDPFERALAQLAKQQAREEILLARSRARQELGEHALALGGGTRSLDLREAREGFVHLRERELGRARGRLGERVFQARVADADLALAGVAAQVSDAERDLGDIEPAQAFRERVDFREAAARRGDALGSGEQFGEQHDRWQG